MDREHPVSLVQLRAEIGEPNQSDGVNTAAGDIISEVKTSLFGSEQFEFEELYIKTSLDEILLAHVALRESNVHGKQLLDDIGYDLDTVLSSGTVYPHLHELCEEDILERHELTQTKEYTIQDGEMAESRIANTVRQHLALGMVLRSVLEHGDFN